MFDKSKAFHCGECPKHSNENGCPAWWEDVWQHEVDQSVTTMKGCAFVLLPKYLKWLSGRQVLATNTALQTQEAVAQSIGRFATGMDKFCALIENMQGAQDGNGNRPDERIGRSDDSPVLEGPSVRTQ